MVQLCGLIWFSPHTRGCSHVTRLTSVVVPVFPAYAGMFLPRCGVRHIGDRFPRIRGDVPAPETTPLPVYSFSPHTRGCSYISEHALEKYLVFPAYAGMFLKSVRFKGKGSGFPRIRGDVPKFPFSAPSLRAFSPHTRGCSEGMPLCKMKFGVFPAYAGMFRRLAMRYKIACGFPRIRGDVPLRLRLLSFLHRFSPHTRGCSP